MIELTTAQSGEACSDKTVPLLQRKTLVKWRVLQLAVFAIGFAIFVLLIIWPPIGLHAFWNVLIPVAPALLMVAPGLWRNVCPLSSTALFGRHMGWTKDRRVSIEWQGRLGLIGVGILFLVVPLRHVILDTSGHATAIALGAVGVLSIIMSSQFRWKSAWCSGMCPVHPVERLYGAEPIASFANAHCHECEACVVPCPDSIPGVSPTSPRPTRARWLAGAIMLAAFPGFVWGWFQIPDYAGVEGWSHLGSIYGVPLAAAAATSIVYALLMGLNGSRDGKLIRRVFAGATIACYYWYRLPVLFGFTELNGGVLVDLTGSLPAWFPMASRVVTTIFFVLWLVGQRRGEKTWLVRPKIRAGVATT